ncbi:unnamed protein product [Anisakis simplex]|uniref:Uncharacterized protein n=1 Tax=Anisakis simplex TaxID=6269 RepID=A0A3P6NL15_ANISI|nr:unnamed protein product [Anisakis simplex]
MVELNEVREGQYVMAPLENGLYARARVIQLAVGGDNDSCASKVANYAKVLFIDEGTTGWLAIPCLAKMDPILSYHPWQAIAVSLFKVVL